MNFTLIGIFISALLMISGEAHAVLINFDDQNLTGSNAFTKNEASQTLNIATSAGLVTITGGVVLTNALNQPADESSVYGTSSFAGLQNPITITFAQPVTNVLIDVINGLKFPVDYAISDNQGHSSSFSIVPNTASGVETIGLPTTTKLIDLASLTFGATGFDFFIDNISFNLPISCGPGGCVPVAEPATLPVLGASLVGMFWLRRRGRPLT
jgi:hypothetical protein